MNESFKPQNTKIAATKRIMRDLKDLDKVPVPGLGVYCPDESNPFLLHCNVLINDGPYRGIMIHLILHIPEDYPLTGPAGNIAPGLEFNSRYHGHIHEDYTNGHALCNDLLTNYAAHFRFIDGGAVKQATGWSPGYTLSTVLVQIVAFFADPDLHFTPSSQSIDHLRNMVKNFACITCGHSYAKPIPAIIGYSETTLDKQETKEETMSTEEKEQLKLEQERLQLAHQLIEKLTCGVTKQNVIEDNICLGYPLLIKRDIHNRLCPEIILELISYDAYVAEIQKSGEEKLDFYENLRFRSVTGADYNHWLPLYINSEHFQRGQTIIQNSISIIYNGTAQGSANYDFTPHMALNVLTTLMNKSVVRLFNGEMFESQHAIEAYCHLLRLLMHFIDIYPELEYKINQTIIDFQTGLPGRNKKVVPDMGEFLIQIALSKKYDFNDLKKYVYEEFFARQIFWIQRNAGIRNILDIQKEDLPLIFRSSKISNHLLVFNQEMAETFIFPGAKERLDSLYGFPSATVIEKFQQRIKIIKSINEYSTFIDAIQLNDTIKSKEDIVHLIKRSVQVSNQQGYTNILSIAEQRQRENERRVPEQRWDERREREHRGNRRRSSERRSRERREREHRGNRRRSSERRSRERREQEHRGNRRRSRERREQEHRGNRRRSRERREQEHRGNRRRSSERRSRERRSSERRWDRRRSRERQSRERRSRERR